MVEQEKFPELIGPMEDYAAAVAYACEPCRFSTEDIKTIRLHIALYNHKMKTSKKDEIVLFSSSIFKSTIRSMLEGC